MCEVGAWKSFKDLEDSLTMDELFELYEQAGERQQRLMKVVAAAMGADVSGDGESYSNPDDVHHEYAEQELIGEGGSVLLGYRTVPASGEE